MVYVLGRASRVVIINVNRFHKNRHLQKDRVLFPREKFLPYIIFSLKVIAFLRYLPIIDMFPFGQVPFK